MNQQIVISHKLVKVCACCLLFLFFSCRLARGERKYAGTWQSKSAHVNFHLTLKRNGSYIYNIKCLCPKSISYGSWYLVNNTLVLIQNHYVTDSPSDPQYKKRNSDTLFKKLIFGTYNGDNDFLPKRDFLIEIENGKIGYKYMKK